MGASSDRGARERLKRDLHEAGLRATPARLAVLATLRHLARAMSHGELAEHLEDEGWDRATVYRNLMALTEAGLVRRFDVGDHVWRFSPASDEGEESSSRFICTECGTVEALPEVSVQVPKAPAGHMPRSVKNRSVAVQLSGLCDDCG